MRRLVAVVVAALAILAIPVPNVRADTFLIEDGRVLGNTLFWNWTGSNPIPSAALGGVGVTQTELNFNQPTPEIVVQPEERFSVAPDLSGTFTGFVNLGGDDGVISGEGSLHFQQPMLTAPLFPGSPDELGLIFFSVPFAMSGTISGSVLRFFGEPDAENLLGSFRDDVYGRGTAEIWFEARAATQDYAFAGWRYVFESATPVPEPSTLLLLGTGLGAALRLRNRKAGRSHS